MTIVAATAAKGSPGVSTWCAALVAAWPVVTGRGVVLVDADVAGAGPLSRFQRLGLGDNRGLLGWVGSGGRIPLESQLFRLGDGPRWLLPGIPDVAAAGSLGRSWEAVHEALLTLVEGRELDVVVDVGRLGARHEADVLLARADRRVLVLRSDFDSLSLSQAVRGLLPGGCAALLVGERAPYTSTEVAGALDVDVLAVAPHDPRAARRLTDPARVGGGEPRSSLVRAARTAIENLVQENVDV